MTLIAQRLGFYEPPGEFGLPPQKAISSGVLTVHGLGLGMGQFGFSQSPYFRIAAAYRPAGHCRIVAECEVW